MRRVPDIDLPLIRPEMPYHILPAKAVPDSTNLLAPQHSAHLDQTGVDDRVDRWRQVAALGPALGQPRHDVEVAGPVQQDGVPVEQVRDQHQVPVGGELVGQQLRVGELVADHVGDE